MQNNYKSEVLLSKPDITGYERLWENVIVRNAGKVATLLLNKNYNTARTYEWAIWKTRDMLIKEADVNTMFSKKILEDIFLEPLFPENILKDVMDKNGWTMKELIKAHNHNKKVRFLRIAGLPREGYMKNRECA